LVLVTVLLLLKLLLLILLLLLLLLLLMLLFVPILPRQAQLPCNRSPSYSYTGHTPTDPPPY
jgi:hypothetical protein